MQTSKNTQIHIIKIFIEWLQFIIYNEFVFDFQGCTDEQEELPESAPETLLVFGGGDNEGSFFSDLFTMPVEELRD